MPALPDEFANHISTHAPRTGSDQYTGSCFLLFCHFNPRSPHGERQAVLIASTCCLVFQPTLPARGATTMSFISCVFASTFQPTLPARGATQSEALAAREEYNFNPRSPHGERHAVYRSRI